MTKEQGIEKLTEAGQLQLLRYYDQLSQEEQQLLLTQIEQTDFNQIKAAERTQTKGTITPIEVMTRSQMKNQEEEFRKAGEELIQSGEVAAVLLAGGMGTRLGSDDPKGMYDIGKTRKISIFSRIIDNLMKQGQNITLFVMTSEKNHARTVAFFQEENYFGYPKENIFFFQQEMAPATDFQGKVLLEGKARIATSPNGNGGWFSSMIKAGLEDVLKKRHIQWLNVFAVDNVLQQIADPLFIGATVLGGYASGSKVIKKVSPDEKVGVMCLEDGRPSIVEYYELTDDMRNALDDKGEYAYQYGVILNYLFGVKDLFTIVRSNLPLHVVDKKIPCLDEKGNFIKPETPNGHKYETLILDMIHQMKNTLPFEVIREQEFAPIKNKTGIDSVESAQNLLEKNGILL